MSKTFIVESVTKLKTGEWAATGKEIGSSGRTFNVAYYSSTMLKMFKDLASYGITELVYLHTRKNMHEEWLKEIKWTSWYKKHTKY